MKLKRIMAKTGVGLFVLFFGFFIVGLIYENSGQSITVTLIYLAIIGIVIWGCWGIIELWG